MKKFTKNDEFSNKANEFENYLLIDKKYSKATIDSYMNELYKYYEFICKKNLIFKNINKNNILDYINYLNKTKLTTRSVNHNISVLRSFYKFIVVLSDIDDPTQYIEVPKLKKTLPKVLSYEELKNLLDVDLVDKYSYRNKAMLELMYATGLRVSELTSLKINDIDFDSCVVKTFGKGSKERVIPIGDYAIIFVEKYIKEYRNQLLKKQYTDYLFLNNKGSKISRQAFYKIVENMAIKKNIKTKISPHTLRHSFATHLLDRGADIVSIKELLGHSSLSTTQIYTHISNQKLQDEYNKFHPHG